jgi:hypothetical protein
MAVPAPGINCCSLCCARFSILISGTGTTDDADAVSAPSVPQNSSGWVLERSAESKVVGADAVAKSAVHLAMPR